MLPSLPLSLLLACSEAAPPAAPARAAPNPAEVPPMAAATHRPEPVTLALPDWTCTPSEGDWPNERWLRCTRGAISVELTRWFGEPETPGQPMAIASKRAVEVGGRPAQLLRTSMFDGEEDAVDVVFLRDADWSVRIVLRDCDAATVAGVLGAVRYR